jgi:hypothetical protein
VDEPTLAVQADPPSDSPRPPVQPAAAAQPAADSLPAAEVLQERWSAQLDRMETDLQELHPDGGGSGSGIVSGRFKYLRDAREALKSARNLDDLIALTQGEFRSTFRLRR